MKHLVAILTFFFTLNLSAQGIEFFHGTFAEAQAEAKAQGKLIFMDAYAVWCGPCKMMTNNVFPQQSVGDFFNANFINLKVDMEKGEGVDLRRKYGVSAYPTLLLIDANGEVVESIRGARGAEALIDWAKKAALPNQVLVNKLQEKYDDGNRDQGLMRDLIKVKAAYNQDYSELFQEYLNTLTAEDIVDEANANFIFEQTKTANSPGLKVLNNYKDYFINLKGATAFNNKFIAMAQSTTNEAIKNKDIGLLDEAITFLKHNKVESYKEISSEMQVNYYGKTEDWVNYDKYATKYLSKYKKGDDGAYRDVAWNYYMKVEDVKALAKAEKWMQTNIAQNNNYENNLTQAYLLYKLEKYSEAEDAVNYAIILAGDDKKTQNAQILKNSILDKLGKTKTAE